MTTKEMAEAAGSSVDTVVRKIKELYPTEVVRGRVTRLSQEKAIKVMAELRKTGFVELPQNAEVVPRNAEGPSLDVAALVRETVHATVTELVPALLRAMQAPSGAPVQPVPAALPAPPDLSPRAELRKLVEGYARSRGGGPAFHEAWAELYREYGYRYRRDIARAARNRNQAVLDYAEAECIIGQLYLVACEIFRSAA